MRVRPGIEFADMTDIGCERDRNEDSNAYWEPKDEEELARKGRLAVIADGMGGYEGGEEASRLAVETICESYARASTADLQVALLASMKAAHSRIQVYATDHPELFGMGTTCTAACVANNVLRYVHVGDSRLYLVRDAEIKQLTQDHSYVARLVRSGALRPEEAETHPQRHILTAALGVGDEPLYDAPATPIPLKAGDALLLCTDGLWSNVDDDELREYASSGSAAQACEGLVRLAKQRGGPDNITVQLLRISQNGAANDRS
jgi:serine/threonine protein phosphatase PrpC